MAAKRLLTLAQSYGNKSCLLVMVIYLRCKGDIKTKTKEKIPKQAIEEGKQTHLGPVEGSSSMKITNLPSLKKLKKNSTLKKMRALVNHHQSDDSTDEDIKIDRLEYKARNTTDRKLKNTTLKSDTIDLSRVSKEQLQLKSRKELKCHKNNRSPFRPSESTTHNPTLDSPFRTIPDRSSPSGQSCSEDLSIAFGNEYEEQRPVWPGQMGPVAPSGPFAMDFNRDHQPEMAHQKKSSAKLTSGFGNNFKLCDLRTNSDNLFLKRTDSKNPSSDSSQDFKEQRTSPICEDVDDLKQNSVPVFRPFYHFPSPDSIVQINKSNAKHMAETEQPNFVRSSSKTNNNPARSSIISRKLKALNKLRRGVSVDNKLDQAVETSSNFNLFDSITKSNRKANNHIPDNEKVSLIIIIIIKE